MDKNFERELKELLRPLQKPAPEGQWEAIRREIERRGLQPGNKGIRHPCRLVKLTLLAAAVAAVVLLMVCCPHGNKSRMTPAVGETSVPAEQSGNTVCVNEVTVVFEPYGYTGGENLIHQKVIYFDDVLELLAYDICPAQYPDDLQFSSGENPFTLDYHSDGSFVTVPPHNIFRLDYTGGTGVPRQIVIYCSNITSPVGVYEYRLKDTTAPCELSAINGLSVKIGHLSTTEKFAGFTDKQPTERYVAEFTVAGIHTQVTADNLTLEEFVAVVSSMIR